MMKRCAWTAALAVVLGAVMATAGVRASGDDKLDASVEQLRHAAGRWSVVTEFLYDSVTRQLRFTRFDVQPDRFEPRMEQTEDGGKTWKAGNHQVFRRQA